MKIGRRPLRELPIQGRWIHVQLSSKNSGLLSDIAACLKCANADITGLFWYERGRQLFRLGAGQFNRLRVVFVGELPQFPLSLPVANSVGEGTAFVGLIF